MLNEERLIAQYQRFVEEVKPGDRITLFFYGELGFPVTLQVTVQDAIVRSYAQYKNALCIDFIPKRKRTAYRKFFYPGNTLYIWKGWVDVDSNPYVSSEKNGDMIVKQTMSSFDKRYIERVLKSTSQKPDFILDLDYYTNNDEIEFVYEVVGTTKERFNSLDELLSRYPATKFYSNTVGRKELQNQPSIPNLVGPMWGGYNNGKAVIRYETQEIYNLLSN